MMKRVPTTMTVTNGLQHPGECKKSSYRVLPYLVLVFFMLASTGNVSAEGFELIKDINPGSSSSRIVQMRADDSPIFFWASDTNSDVSRNLWSSNGTTAGTIKITNIDQDIYVTPGRDTDLAVGNNYYYSIRRKSDGKYELWRSGLNTPLMVLPNSIERTGSAGGEFYFVMSGRNELWASDGTVTGTRMVQAGISPNYLTGINDVLYFVSGVDVWITDGKPLGTRLLINFDNSYYLTVIVAVVNDTLYFRIQNNNTPGLDVELWRHESSIAQTSRVKSFTNLPTDTTHYAAVGNILYFLNNTSENPYPDPDYYGLWKSDGSPDGTVFIKEWRGHTLFQSWLTNVSGTLYFRGGHSENRELWKSNGTAFGTVQVKDINGDDALGSDLRCLTAIGNTLFFFEKQTLYVTNLWKSDGTEAGTTEPGFGADPLQCPVNSRGNFYFYGKDRTTDDYGAEFYQYSPSYILPMPSFPMMYYLMRDR